MPRADSLHEGFVGRAWEVSEPTGAAAAITAAAQTGLLAAIFDGARTPAQHAAHPSLSEQAAGAVLDVLVALASQTDRKSVV